MSQSNVWKVWERQVARDLQGERTGPRGFGLPDVILPNLAPECKAQARLTLRNKDMAQAETNRVLAGKRWWTLLLRENKTARKVAVLPYDYFVHLYTNQKEEE